jgi:hypothetical protein
MGTTILNLLKNQGLRTTIFLGEAQASLSSCIKYVLKKDI